MMFTLSTKKITQFLIACSAFFLFAVTSFAHPLIPFEVVEYIEQNPQATDADIENFFIENFGTIEEYYGIPEGEQDFTLKELYEPPEEFMALSEVEQNQFLEEQEKARKNLRIFLDLQSGVMTPIQHFITFVKLGFEHILEGLDHILFVIAMILVLPPWRKIFALITTFTVAHSLTLLLAGTGVLTLSAKIVEPIIAFSIGFIAINSVFGKNGKFAKHPIHPPLSKEGLGEISRETIKDTQSLENDKSLPSPPFKKRGESYSAWTTALLTVFVFGLFHGLGFAGLLADFQIPQGKVFSTVLFFNIGVELGQIFIIALTLPVLYLISKTPFFRLFIRLSAIALAVVSMGWVVERVAL